MTREQRHWGAFPATLSAALDAPVHCVDAPGFGTENARRSPRSIQAITDDIRSSYLPDRRSGESLVGISLGGMVALDWCARYPDDFARCVVINTSGWPSWPHERFRSAALGVALRRNRSPEAAERAALAISSNRASVELDELARQWSEWAVATPPEARSTINQLIAASTFRCPPALSVSLLVLAAKGDRLVSPRCSDLIAMRYRAPIRIHPTAGHDLPLDEPDWVCTQIAQWVTADPTPAHHQ